MGRGGLTKNAMAHMAGGRVEVQLQVYVRHKFIFTGLFKIRNKIKGAIQIAKHIHYHLSRTVKKRKLDLRSLIGTLNGHFPVALYSSLFIF